MTNFDPEAYTLFIQRKDGLYEGSVTEFPNIRSYEDTVEKSHALLIDAIRTLKYIADEEGKEFPPPLPHPLPHFNRLTPAQAERLALLSEECGEVIQAIGKIQRHGYNSQHPNGGPTNLEQLEHEIGDVLAAVELLYEDLSRGKIRLHAEHKAQAVTQYLHHQ